MSLSTIKLTKGASATVAQVQGAFVFYKKSTSATSDVNVFADNALIATMSPTDSFSVNKTFNQLRFEPADVNNEAVFITAESAEDYKTSSVAGSVSIVGVPTVTVGSGSINIAQDFFEYLTRANASFIARINPSLATTVGTEDWSLVNISGATIYLDQITVAGFNADSTPIVPVCEFYKFTGITNAPTSTFSASKRDSVNNPNVYTSNNAVLTGPTAANGCFYGSIKFAGPIALKNNESLKLIVYRTAGTGARTICITFEFHA